MNTLKNKVTFKKQKMLQRRTNIKSEYECETEECFRIACRSRPCPRVMRPRCKNGQSLRPLGKRSCCFRFDCKESNRKQSNGKQSNGKSNGNNVEKVNRKQDRQQQYQQDKDKDKEKNFVVPLGIVLCVAFIFIIAYRKRRPQLSASEF